MSRIDDIRTSTLTEASFGKLYFPTVDYDEKTDMSWIKGLSYGGHAVGQALRQTKIAMDRYGIRVKDAVAMGMALGGSMSIYPDLVIGDPFFLWIERPGMPVPILYAYMDKEHWKDPNKKNK